jgi:hypothetical protein
MIGDGKSGSCELLARESEILSRKLGLSAL